MQTNPKGKRPIQKLNRNHDASVSSLRATSAYLIEITGSKVTPVSCLFKIVAPLEITFGFHLLVVSVTVTKKYLCSIIMPTCI